MYSRIVCALIVASPFAVGQTVGSLEAATPVGALIRSANSRTFATVPRGTKRTWNGSQVSLLALARIGASRDAVSVEAKLDRQASTGAILATVEASAGVNTRGAGVTMATTNSTTPASALPGAVDLRFVHPARSGTKRVFTFEFLPVNNDPRAQTSFIAEVDVGDDRSVEWRAPVRDRQLVSRKITVTAGSRGFVVLLRLNVRSTSSATQQRSGWFARLNYAIGQRRKCVTSIIGPSCGPLLIARVPTVDGPLVLEGQRGYSRGVGVLLLGARQVSLPLPPTTCRLLTIPIVALPHTTGVFGNSPRITIPIPPSLVGDSYWQIAHSSFASPRPPWLTSNAIRLRCTKF